MEDVDTKLDSFYPHCFKKSDKLTDMGVRDGCYFMQVLMDEFEENLKC